MQNYRDSIHASAIKDMHDYNMPYNISDFNSHMCLDIDKMPIAMGYVPWQRWKTVYDLNKALQVGTIFPELDKPYTGIRRD
jgi:hypothetical protein